MKSHFCRPGVEVLESREVPSTVAFADFNHDGLMDMAALVAPKTINVSLANPDGSYTASATLTAQKPITAVGLWDLDSDGELDIYGSGSKQGDYYSFFFMSNGDGTFDYLEPWKTKPTHGGTW